MDLKEMKLGEVAKLVELLGGTKCDDRGHSLTVGEKVLIRTVTMTYTGRIESITQSDLVLRDAAWVASVGRYAAALSTGELDEVEPYPDRVVVCRGGIIDVAPWDHPLPREVK